MQRGKLGRRCGLSHQLGAHRGQRHLTQGDFLAYVPPQAVVHDVRQVVRNCMQCLNAGVHIALGCHKEEVASPDAFLLALPHQLPPRRTSVQGLAQMVVHQALVVLKVNARMDEPGSHRAQNRPQGLKLFFTPPRAHQFAG
ncbi:hypothetical protein D3C72_1850580 [compost metagenome]